MENQDLVLIEACARAAHEANRSYCAAIGDDSIASWENAPQWQAQSARQGVALALGGATSEQMHENWRKHKEETGWKYGPVKDPAKREHPCMVPYGDLPPEQRVKDELYSAVVKAVAHALANSGR